MKSTNNLELMKKQFSENVNSHVFLVETNSFEKCLADIKSLIKYQISADDTISNQIEEETYLENIIIRPDGKEIIKDQILFLQKRLKTKPILSKYLFYIIIPAETLSEISANKLLKTIEEPNENNIGFLITSNSDLIISTIKSRCEHIHFMYEDNDAVKYEIDDNITNITKEIILAIEQKNHINFTKSMMQEKILKDNYKSVENLIKKYYNTACKLTENTNLDKTVLDYIIKNNSYQQLIKKAKILNKLQNKLYTNMNGRLTLENIFFQLKGE